MARIELKDNSSIKIDLDDRFIIIERESNSLKFILCNEDSKIVDRGILIQDAMHEKDINISLDDITKIVVGVTGISLIAMRNQSRRRSIVDAASLFSIISRKYTLKSFKAIGEHINKNHSTIVYHVSRAGDLLLYDKAFNLTLNKVENQIKDLIDNKESKRIELIEKL